MDDYEFIDAGGGARLERFGDRLVDRPHPAALGARLDPEAWDGADLFFEPAGGWRGRSSVAPWTMTLDGLTLELRPTPAGQVGLFPEQRPMWRWLEQQATRRPVSVLNLFAATGAASLTLAQAGASVTHVDASRPTVGWARRNAELSGLAERPVRWIVDDVPAYVGRELRRGRSYDGVILDPPTYGHGRRHRSWSIEADLPALLDAVVGLVRERDGFVLLSAHTPGFGPDILGGLLTDALRGGAGRIETGELDLVARSGRRLGLGAFARRTAR